jgi:FdhD protein
MTTDHQGGERRDILLYDRGTLAGSNDWIIREIPLEVWINDRKVITIACTGLHVEELAVGFLRSEGCLRTRDDLAEMTVSADGRQVRIRTADGREIPERWAGRTLASSGARSIGPADEVFPAAPLHEAVQVTPDELFSLMDRFLMEASLHQETGGTHAAALTRAGKIVVVREDIGRHNTIDMLGGYALMNGTDCRDAVILRTGRVSAEIVQKIRQLGAPVVVSLSVPTTLAVEMARRVGMTLIGSVRGGRMKIYSHEGRVRI